MDDSSFGIDDELRVRGVAQVVLQIVVHIVGDPGDLRSQGPLRLFDVQQAFFQRERLHVTIVLGVGQRFVDVKKLDPFGLVIDSDRLQTGDVTDERRSRQATKDKHGIVAFEAAQTKLFSVRVEACQIGQHLADLR